MINETCQCFIFQQKIGIQRMNVFAQMNFQICARKYSALVINDHYEWQFII